MKIFLLSIFILTTSCASLVGIKSPKPLSKEQIVEVQKSLEIPDSVSYFINESFDDALKSCSQVEKKNHIQPLQISFYTNNKLNSSFINCYASGFPLLNWNPKGNMDSFPPKTLAPIDDCLSLSKHLSLITPVEKSATLNDTKLNSYKNVVVIHWNNFMLKQTKHMLSTFRNAYKDKLPANALIIYVNNDNYFKE